LKGSGATWRAGPEQGRSRGSRAVAPGEEEGGGEESADARGPAVREREEEESGARAGKRPMEPADVEQERPMGRWTTGRGERGGAGLNWAEARPTRGKGEERKRAHG
jgi:hypothetical protein